MFKKLFSCLASFLLVAAFLAGRSAAEAPQGAIKIAVHTANIRSGPINTAAMIAQANRGETFPVISEHYGWYEIQLRNGQTGWVAGYLTSGTAMNQSQNPKRTGTVNADHVNVRNGPSLSSQVTGKIHTGEKVEVIGEQGSWIHVLYKGQKAWISNQYVQAGEKKDASGFTFAVITKDGTNIRSGPGPTSEVIVKASEGERYPIISRKGDWYEIRTASWEKAYVASWVVSVQGKNESVKTASSPTQAAVGKTKNITKVAGTSVNRTGGLAGKTIILDPGHGGFDPGTSSVRGLPEKNLTMATARLLEQKLEQAGANVRLTRSNDSYVPLQTRVHESHRYEADAFISVHYDSSNFSGSRGFTTYYNHTHQKELASHINLQLARALPLADRGIRRGDYFVIRENSRPAVLLELGYLSNPRESGLVSTPAYQELAANSVVKGLQSYFSQ